MEYQNNGTLNPWNIKTMEHWIPGISKQWNIESLEYWNKGGKSLGLPAVSRMQSHSTWATLTQINPLEKQKWNVGMKFCCVLLGSIVFKKAISDGLCELGFPVGLKYGPPYDANNWITENIGIKVCCFFIGSILSSQSEPRSYWGFGITRSQIQTRCLCCGWWSLKIYIA